MSERNLHWTIFPELLRSLGKLYCKVVNAYLHVGVSIVYASIFKLVIRATFHSR